MKRKIRLISVIVLLCICGAFLSSCEYIDDLRSKRAVYIQEDGETKILIDGKTYVELEGMRQQINGYRADASGYVAEEDLPILLIEILGDKFYYNSKKDLILTDGRIYCNKDMYDYYIGFYESMQ